jgi:hypothetical protein
MKASRPGIVAQRSAKAGPQQHPKTYLGAAGSSQGQQPNQSSDEGAITTSE